jgi:hypothetical protein
MSAAKRSSEEAIVAVRGLKREATGTEIAAAAGLGRSTVGKVLARLERAGRAPAQHRQPRRRPPVAGPLGARRAQEAGATKVKRQAPASRGAGRARARLPRRARGDRPRQPHGDSERSRALCGGGGQLSRPARRGGAGAPSQQAAPPLPARLSRQERWAWRPGTSFARCARWSCSR